MPVRGIQDYLSSGEATEEFFNDTNEGSQLLTKYQIMDLGTNPENTDSIHFTPQDPAPTYAEGTIFYDEGAKTLSVYSDKPDFTLNLGQEEVIRVVNRSGATIPNGTPCYLSGVYGGIPQIAPAVASASTTAIVLGITTHEILDGDQGFATRSGLLGGDFSGFTPGEVVYLDNVTPGGYVSAPAPDLASKLGHVLVGDVDGSLLVRIANLIALPATVGWLYGLSSHTYDLTGNAAATPLIEYDDSDNAFLTVDATAGTISVEHSGIYRLSATFTMTFTVDANADRTVILDLYNNTGDILITSFAFPIPGTSSTIITGTITAPMRITTGSVAQLRVRALGDSILGVSFQNIDFALESIQLR